MDSTPHPGADDLGARPAPASHRRQAAGRTGHRRKPPARPRAALGAIAGTAALAVMAGGAYTLFGPAQSGTARTGDDTAAGPAVTAPDLPAAGTEKAATVDAAATITGPGEAATPSPAASPSPSAAPASPSAAPTTAKPPAAAPTTAKAAKAAAAPAATTPDGRADGFVAQVAQLVNAERAKAGCGPLRLDVKLNAAAQHHSDDMVARHFFDHADPDGRHADSRIEAAGYRWGSWGENIAYGQADPAAVMDAWMHSPGHRANILNCDFKDIGIGVNFGAKGPWWTQVFASPR
ncbi:CAP domain-containing protein [Kitasatospora sp. NPDC088346]|uniref:CAP domain-containing protein n=1 Tax=Kitasatospora sp. NPDC088346 TaxID=3364073 RepID=UPI00380B1440